LLEKIFLTFIRHHILDQNEEEEEAPSHENLHHFLPLDIRVRKITHSTRSKITTLEVWREICEEKVPFSVTLHLGARSYALQHCMRL
jgi:hypothetical protein